MHVVFCNQFSFSYLGGVEHHILNLAKELRRNGVDVSLLCRDNAGRSGWQPDASGINVVRARNFSEMFTFMKAHRKTIDICHAHMSRKPFAFCGLLCARILGIPSVFTPHCFYPSASALNSAQKWIYDHTFTRATVTLADRIVNLTPCDQAHAVRFGMPLSKSRVIPNSIRISQLESSTSLSFKAKHMILNDYLLYVGRFSREKCVDFLVRNHISFPHLSLVLIGQDDGELSKILHLASRLGLSDRVHIIQRASSEDVRAAYREALALVLASRYEGLPTVILEAMALGTPSIAPRVGGIPYIEPHGELYTWGDDGGYVDCVRTVSGRDRRNGVSRSEIFERYDWEVNGLKILALYRDLVEERKSPSRVQLELS